LLSTSSAKMTIEGTTAKYIKVPKCIGYDVFY